MARKVLHFARAAVLVLLAALVPEVLATHDTNQYCAIWAVAGECERNAEYMGQECAQSCSAVASTRKPTQVCDENVVSERATREAAHRAKLEGEIVRLERVLGVHAVELERVATESREREQQLRNELEAALASVTVAKEKPAVALGAGSGFIEQAGIAYEKQLKELRNKTLEEVYNAGPSLGSHGRLLNAVWMVAEQSTLLLWDVVRLGFSSMGMEDVFSRLVSRMIPWVSRVTQAFDFMMAEAHARVHWHCQRYTLAGVWFNTSVSYADVAFERVFDALASTRPEHRDWLPSGGDAADGGGNAYIGIGDAEQWLLWYRGLAIGWLLTFTYVVMWRCICGLFVRRLLNAVLLGPKTLRTVVCTRG